MALKTKLSEFTQTTQLSGSDVIPLVRAGSPNINKKVSVDTIGNYIVNSYQLSGSSAGTPEMYGAAGDGTTDDFLAFKHALISHSIVELGAKTYAVRGWIGMPSHRSLVGKGKDRTVIKLMDNSPYGYGDTLYVIQNTVLQNDVHWTGSVVGTSGGTGSIELDYRDTTVRDESPSSPFYHQSQTQAWAGLGYWQYDTSVSQIGARKNILIEGLTVDCNFDKQARHASYNHSDNPYSASHLPGTGYYIPQYANRVRSTVNAIVLNGENIVLKDVKVKNYGYGCAAATAGPLNYANSATLPPYNENFPLLINGDVGVNYTSSDFNIGSDGTGLSKYRGNYAIGCEVLDIASTDLMNPFSNTTAIYVTNQAINNSTGRSSFTSEGGIFDCIVDPGQRLKTPSASLWSGSYLDGFVSTSLKQTASSLAEWLFTAQGSLTGSNGQVAMSDGSPGGPPLHLKKISGSWYPLGGYYTVQEHNVQGFSGYRMSRCLARNLEIGFYLDSWRNNAFLDNNQMVDVTSGFRYVVSDISLTASFKNVVIKDNYIKLSPHERAYAPGHGVINYALTLASASGSTLRHIDNLVIEDNVFELPVSSSSNVYGLGNSTFNGYPRYVGFYLQHDVTPSGSLQRTHRATSIKNNKFFNWRPLKSATTSAGELYGYNIPFYFVYTTGSMGMDADDPAGGPYPLSVEKFKREVLPNWIIEDNTYSDSDYPSTSSLVPLTIQITGTGTNYFYPIDQINRFAGVTANSITSITGSIRSLYATGSLYGTASYALNVITGLWNTSSFGLELEESGSVQDEDGNIVSINGEDFVYTTSSVSIGSIPVSSGFALYVSRSIKILGELSQGDGSLPLGSYSHAQGQNTLALGISSHAEGYYTSASGWISHAEGRNTLAEGEASHAEGSSSIARGDYSHAEGFYCRSFGTGSHSEGFSTETSGSNAHSEGEWTWASGDSSHAEGTYSTASAGAAHAEGKFTIAAGIYSHTEGGYTVTTAAGSHAEGGFTLASGTGAHAEGYFTTASAQWQHVSGKYNVADSNTNVLFIIGNGSGDSSRSNILTVTTSSLQVNGFVSPLTSSTIPNITGSMFYSGSNLFVFTGNGTAGGLVGWKTASLGG